MKKICQMIECNPTVKLMKNEFYPLIDIDKINIGYKIVSSNEIVEYIGQSCSKFQNGDTLMARITPCLENGKIAQCRIPSLGLGSTEFFVFRAKEGKADNDYVYYLFNTSYMRKLAANSMSGASGRQRADINFIKNRKWNFPSLPIQCKISNVLSQYDALIENNNKRIKLLEQMAENLYKHTFTYDKVHNNSGEIKLNKIIKIIRGVSYSSEEIEVPTGNNLINLKNIQGFGGFRRDGLKLYNGKFKQEQTVSYGDLVMGVTDMTQDRRTVGAVALIPKLNGTSVISADLVKLVSDINNKFLYSMFRYGNLSKYISQFANGANVLHLKPQAVLDTKIMLPEQPLIDKYVSILEPIFNQIENLNICNQNLIKQRDLLLPRLMSGKLEV